jgi:hypothetical protein
MRQVIQWRWTCDRCNRPVAGQHRVKEGAVIVNGWRVPRGYAGLLRKWGLCPDCARQLGGERR